MTERKTRYVVMCAYRGFNAYPVFTSNIKEEAVRESLTLNRHQSNKGLFFVITKYPIADMKTSNLDKFIQLVSDCRFHERKFWKEGRSRQELDISLDLESKLDKYLASCKTSLAARPDYQPQPDAKAFFDLVDQWRTKTKEYFRYKKRRDADPTVRQEMLDEVKKMERDIDDVISQYTQYKEKEK